MIQLDPASLAIGYAAGTMLCWYLNQTLNAKESEYEREDDGATDKDYIHYKSSIYGWNYPYDRITPDREQAGSCGIWSDVVLMGGWESIFFEKF